MVWQKPSHCSPFSIKVSKDNVQRTASNLEDMLKRVGINQRRDDGAHYVYLEKVEEIPCTSLTPGMENATQNKNRRRLSECGGTPAKGTPSPNPPTERMI
jgi:hypothetical protein